MTSPVIYHSQRRCKRHIGHLRDRLRAYAGNDNIREKERWNQMVGPIRDVRAAEHFGKPKFAFVQSDCENSLPFDDCQALGDLLCCVGQNVHIGCAPAVKGAAE